MKAGAGKDPGLALHKLEPAAGLGALDKFSYWKAEQNSSYWAEPHHLLEWMGLMHNLIFSASTSLKMAFSHL